MWSSRTPQRALQQTRRTEFRAPEHLEELSSSLQGPSFELPNTSRSSHAASQDRMPSSRTSRGAGKQPPRNEFRAPKQASQEESKQSKGKQASKQPSKQASNQTSKRANEQTSKRANEQASTRPNEQTSKQASNQEVGGVPRYQSDLMILHEIMHEIFLIGAAVRAVILIFRDQSVGLIPRVEVNRQLLLI